MEINKLFKVVKHLGLSLILIFFSFNLVAQQNAVKPIKLGWDFFKNDKPTADAQTFYNLAFSYDADEPAGTTFKVKIKIRLTLDTARSYFDSKALDNRDLILKHEQGHVDIGVIHAFKLDSIFKKALFVRKDITVQIKKIGDSVIRAMQLQNLKYDEETNHSLNLQMQQKWDLYFKNAIMRYELLNK